MTMEYGTITGRLVAAVADTTDDPDVNPDIVPISGTVTFTPSVKAILVVSEDITVVPAPIVAALDANGYVSLNGVQGVTVLATNSTYYNPTGWTYRVSFDNLSANGRRVTFDPYNIEVPVGSNVDLSFVTPITGSTGTAIVRGPKGDVGPQGPQGDPGPSDTQVATYFNSPSSTRTAADARYVGKGQLITNVADYPAAGGLIDETSLTAAVTAAGAGGVVYVPRSANLRINNPVSYTDVSIISNFAVISVPVDLGANVYALTINGTGSQPMSVLENFELRGLSNATAVGTSPAAMHGIQLIGQARPKLTGVRVRGFNRGITMRTDTGHIYFDKCDFTSNYYGGYIAKNTSDYFVIDSSFNGNKFAGLATPADQGIDSFHFQNSHFGFQPYGIYQEATTEAGSTQQGTPRVFLQDGYLDHARFESIGNAAIRSAATNDANNRSSVNAVKIVHPGHSWNSQYRIAALPRDYALDAGFFDRTLEIDSGAFPFQSGDINVFHFKQASSSAVASIRGMNVSASQFVVDTGTPTVLAGVMNAIAQPIHPYIPGAHYGPAGVRGTSNRPNGFQTFQPFQVTSRAVFTGLGVEIVTAGVAGSQLRLSVYSAGGGKPNALIADAGVVAADSTGIKTITSLTLDLAPGWYFLAATVLNASTTPLPVMRTINGVLAGAPIYTSGGTLAAGPGWLLSGQTVAAATATNATTTDTVIAVTLIA